MMGSTPVDLFRDAILQLFCFIETGIKFNFIVLLHFMDGTAEFPDTKVKIKFYSSRMLCFARGVMVRNGTQTGQPLRFLYFAKMNSNNNNCFFEDKLYTIQPGENECYLPSPEALREKILIKVSVFLELNSFVRPMCDKRKATELFLTVCCQANSYYIECVY